MITIAFPLITVPYISRVLKPDGVGIYSFTNSIIQFFIMFGMLGIGVYGIKVIAEVRDNKTELSKKFLSIYLLQFLLTSISCFLYIIFVYYFYENDKDKLIAYLQIIALLATMIDCSWFFSGLEEFKKIVIRNIMVKLVSLITIFIFVNNETDVYAYTIIMGASVFFGQLLLWFHIKKYLTYVSIKLKDIFNHFKPTFIYFLPQVALQIYFVINKIMLGVLSSNSEVGIFDYSDKILKVTLTIVTSLGTIMLPRMVNTFSKGEVKKAHKYVNKSLEFSSFLAIALMFGLSGIATEMIPWYMGEDFEKVIDIIIILSPTILFMAWSGVFGTQYLLPLGKIKEYTISVYVGAFTNVVVNIILIKNYGSIGAAIGTLVSEFTVLMIQILYIRLIIDFKKQITNITIYLLSGIIMYIAIRAIGSHMGAYISTTVVQIASGLIVYVTLVFFFEFLNKGGLILDNFRKKLKHYNS